MDEKRDIPSKPDRWQKVHQAVFDLTEAISLFRFIVNPDLDSLANRIVWIRELGRV